MKRLMFMISTENKTPEQISDEAKKAFEKYQKVEKKVSRNKKNVPESNK